ncbi:MAG: LysR family glycine cleavage system transcriptional activator [Halieaceae bacterium]|jgi:LysR family glycine cleavage system transcriptional activator
MARKLPPLNSLRAFECAARHMSFTLASGELNVTPAAVSHQVKALETFLGVALFTRLTRKLVLTGAGESLLPEVSESFDRIRDAVGGINTNVVNQRLTVRLGPSLAARWLSPRMHLFWQRYPMIDLCLYHSNSAVDFDREDIDLAITYGTGRWQGVVAARLLEIDYFPVCSPKLLGSESSASGVSLLLNQTLLHDSGYGDWEAWLSQNAMSQINSHHGIVIDDTNVLIQAAVDGQGVALCSTLFVQDHLDAGRLVRPFPTDLTSELAYYIVCPRSHLRRPAVQDFKDWLLSLT